MPAVCLPIAPNRKGAKIEQGLTRIGRRKGLKRCTGHISFGHSTTLGMFKGAGIANSLCDRIKISLAVFNRVTH
jgi:hypothetical protein